MLGGFTRVIKRDEVLTARKNIKSTRNKTGDTTVWFRRSRVGSQLGLGGLGLGTWSNRVRKCSVALRVRGRSASSRIAS